MKPLYEENPSEANGLREDYKNGLLRLIRARGRALDEDRRARGREIANRREECRAAFQAMLGWPLTEPPRPALSVEETVLRTEGECRVSRLRLEIFPGLWFYGVLLLHADGAPRPMIIAQHGGAGTPELCSSFYPSTNYNDMSVRIFENGANVFAPQLLLWREGAFGADSGRLEIEYELARQGSSIAAMEIYSIGRCIDALEARACGPLGMIGLSYGGFYALYTAACDTRILAALDCSFFTDRETCYGGDFAWRDGRALFSDAEAGALVCPRALRIEYGDDDLGKYLLGADAEYERLRQYYAECPERLTRNVFRGTHEFCPDDGGIQWILSFLRHNTGTIA